MPGKWSCFCKKTIPDALTWSVLMMVIINLSLPELSAQNRFTGRILGGVNLAQIDGDQLSGFNKIGFQAGARVNGILTDRWEFSLGMLFSQQGSSLNLNDSPSATIDRINLNLIEAPLLIHFNDWKFQVGAGLSYARLIDFQAEDIFGEDITAQQNFNENLFQVIVEATFNFSDKFGLNVRWSRQLNNLQAEAGAGTYIARAIGIRGLYRL